MLVARHVYAVRDHHGGHFRDRPVDLLLRVSADTDRGCLPVDISIEEAKKRLAHGTRQIRSVCCYDQPPGKRHRKRIRFGDDVNDIGTAKQALNSWNRREKTKTGKSPWRGQRW